MSADAVAQPPAHDGVERPPLDDVMLAMDVVDTLRRRERIVERELDEAGREQDLKERLKRIYAQQGIEVPDHVIEAGVAALREERFTYKPIEGGLRRTLALAYVRRGKWGKWLGGGIAAAVLAGAANYFAFIAPEAALPDDLAARHAALSTLAASDNARDVIEKVYTDGVAALQRDDTEASRKALRQLDQLGTLLQQEFVIQVVNRAGERSGVWRVPDVNQDARNLYIVVEGISPSGERVRVPVTSEETGDTTLVEQWGLRVDDATFEGVRRDKQDDGIIQNDRFGYKQRGYLKPDYEMPTTGGAITQW